MTETSSRPPLEMLTFQTARDALERGLAALRAGQTEFDLSSVRMADSAGVAVLLAMQRAGREAGQTVSFLNLPLSLRSLATVYGVAPLLDAAPAKLQHH